MVCPASLVAQWKLEVEKRVKKGNLSVWLHHGNKREERAKALAKYDMVITSYNILAREVERNGVCYDVRQQKFQLNYLLLPTFVHFFSRSNGNESFWTRHTSSGTTRVP